MIKPEPGRHVHYIPAGLDDFDMAMADGQPMAAIIACVHGDRRVNLAVFDASGKHWERVSVLLVQPEDANPADGPYCRWMPYTISSEKKRQQEALSAL